MRLRDTLANLELDVLVSDAPRDVMHRADPPGTALCVGHLADFDVLARPAAADAESMPTIFLAVARELEHFGEERRSRPEISFPDANRVQSAHLPLGRHGTARPRLELALIGRLDQRELLAVRIAEREHAFAATQLF